MAAPPPRRVVSNPDAEDDRRADADGLTRRRDLFQMRRPLPIDARLVQEASAAAPTRPLRPGTDDEDRWIAVNNAAFADHPDQSAMTTERLHAQLAEGWFDAEGFRLHERDGELAAFCWTKEHPATEDDPAMGEIYVIGVAPGFQGLGLGRALTVAGLAHLAERGHDTAMLYVEATNDAALGLYESLGFTRHHRDRVYEAP